MKRAVDAVKAFLELLGDPKTDFSGKLMDYAKLREDVFEFTRYYARWLGAPLAKRLRAEISQLLEEAIAWGDDKKS